MALQIKRKFWRLLGKATGLPKRSPYPMPYPAIVPFYPCRALFPGRMAVFHKSRKKTVPIVCRYLSLSEQ
jgi:hypothetical protein